MAWDQGEPEAVNPQGELTSEAILLDGAQLVLVDLEFLQGGGQV